MPIDDDRIPAGRCIDLQLRIARQRKDADEVDVDGQAAVSSEAVVIDDRTAGHAEAAESAEHDVSSESEFESLRGEQEAEVGRDLEHARDDQLAMEGRQQIGPVRRIAATRKRRAAGDRVSRRTVGIDRTKALRECLRGEYQAG